MKKMKIAHWIFTGLFSAMMLMSASMYIMNYEAMSTAFPAIGFPSWLVYPLAAAKFLGILMLITKFRSWLTEWAYAGFAFNLLLAIGAHISIGGVGIGQVLIALLLLTGSYVTWRIQKNKVVIA